MAERSEVNFRLDINVRCYFFPFLGISDKYLLINLDKIRVMPSTAV